jgi:hypothetical protein
VTSRNTPEAAAAFARRLIREGEKPGVAMYKAANYYRVAVVDVAEQVRQASARDDTPAGSPGPEERERNRRKRK